LGIGCQSRAQQVPPLRYAPVGMTLLLWRDIYPLRNPLLQESLCRLLN
jgi:hypothetical protein